MNQTFFKAMRPLMVSLAGVLVVLTAVAADGYPCGGLDRPTVEVVPRLINPQLNINTPAEQLSLAAQISRAGDTDGLTDFKVDGELNLLETTVQGGCPVRAIQAVVKPSRLEVYIAKEVPPSSCRFRAVYDHELKHVMLAQRAIDRVAAPLKKKLMAAVADLSSEDARDVGAIRAALAPVLRAQMAVLVAEYSQGNAELDTPEEALRLANLCQDPQVFVGHQILSVEPHIFVR